MVHESMMPSNFTATGGGESGYSSPFWAVIILVVFFVVIAMFWRRDDHKKDGVLESVVPAMLLQQNSKKNDDYCHEHWSLLKEQSDIKKEIMQVGWQNDKSVLENRTAMALGFKENEILGLKSTSEIMLRIDNLEKSFKNDEIRRLESKANYLETIVGVRGLGAVPSVPHAYYPVHHGCTPTPQFA